MLNLKKKNTLSNIYLFIILLAAIIICGNRFSFSYSSFISYGFFGLLIASLIFLSGRIRLSIALSSVLIIILQLLNQIKTHYYKERLFFPDVSIALDPNNLGTLIQYPMALVALIALFMLFLFTGFVFIKTTKVKTFYRCLSLFCGVLLVFALNVVSQNENNIKDWQSTLPKGKSTITNLFISAQKMYYEAPVYTENADYFLQQQSDNYQPTTTNVKPDIVALLQESTLNPTLYNITDITLPTLDMFAESPSTCAHSLLRVQTFGGGTWLSEFSLLTGLDTDDFQFRKNSVFYTVAPHIQTSLFKEMKNNGYYTVVLSPMQEGNYNAGPTYRNFGIDLILQPQDLGYPASKQTNLWTIPSATMLDYAKQILNRQTTLEELALNDKPIFLFVLTMAEHGPYDESHPDDLQISKQITDKKSTAMFNSYVERLQLLSQANTRFTDYIVNRDKPTMFLYFGDHQPNAGWKNGYSINLPNPDYLTQFYLQDNLNTQKIKNMSEITDISFLGGILLERAGLSVTPFYDANIKMRHLCQGKLADCGDQKLVESYKHYIYQDLKNAGNQM